MIGEVCFDRFITAGAIRIACSRRACSGTASHIKVGDFPFLARGLINDLEAIGVAISHGAVMPDLSESQPHFKFQPPTKRDAQINEFIVWYLCLLVPTYCDL